MVVILYIAFGTFRPEEYINQPFITIEVFTRENGKSYLEQAYHRFNEDCNEFEATII